MELEGAFKSVFALRRSAVFIQKATDVVCSLVRIPEESPTGNLLGPLLRAVVVVCFLAVRISLCDFRFGRFVVEDLSRG